MVNRKYDDQSGVLFSSPLSPPYSYELECFDVMRYYQMATWVYPDTTKEVVYDQDGLNPQTNITFHYYDSAINLQLSRLILLLTAKKAKGYNLCNPLIFNVDPVGLEPTTL